MAKCLNLLGKSRLFMLSMDLIIEKHLFSLISPLDLLRDTNSAFYHMCRNSGEFENLLELAKTKHELVDIS